MRLIKPALLGAALLVTSPLLALAQDDPLSAWRDHQRHASPPKLKVLGPAPASQPVEFDVVLPLTNPAGLDALLAEQQDPASPQYHHWLKPAEFAARFGADQQIVNAVASTLKQFGLQVTPQSRSLHVAGTATQVNMAFNVSLSLAANAAGQQQLIADRPLTAPATLSSAGAVVSAFKASSFQAMPAVRRSAGGYMNRSTRGYTQGSPSGLGYFYNDLKQAYGYPSYQATMSGKGKGPRLDGSGTTVAVVMASDVLDTDIAALFDQMNFKATSGQPSDPTLFARRPVNGSAIFSTTNTASEEATIDVEQVLGGAPGAHVILYDTPDLTDQSLISAYTAIVNDDVADVVSLSFGQCELYYTRAYNNGSDQTAVLNIFSELFKQGNAEGITFIAASGDAGGLGCLNPAYFSGGSGQFIAGVSVPAADPNVTAVGGTNLVTAGAIGGSDSAYVRENAWSDPELAFDPFGVGVSASGGLWGSGGGVSTIYARPWYQSLVSTGSWWYRTVPDVAMEMGGCPDIAQAPCNGGNTSLNGWGNIERSSLTIVFNGQLDSVVGTSAAAPEMASAVALLVETQGRQGNINPFLYTLARRQASGGAAYFHENINGFNGNAPGSGAYDLTTGVGSPDVATMLGLTNINRAGAPHSASNP
ncbi:S53 family peptidase [Lichenicoccus sp.]|uniref:S53 family peptidase n=1 Tax=Lichenicoccus sp. TaxID=2781899 RepID=UPI003D0E1E8A